MGSLGRSTAGSPLRDAEIRLVKQNGAREEAIPRLWSAQGRRLGALTDDIQHATEKESDDRDSVAPASRAQTDQSIAGVHRPGSSA
jgi:hypothetical protein